MRYFGEDDSGAATVTLSKKDWMMLATLMTQSIRKMQDANLRRMYSDAMLDLMKQAG